MHQWHSIESGGCPIISVPGVCVAPAVVSGELLPFCGYSASDDLLSLHPHEALDPLSLSLASGKLGRFTLLAYEAGASLAQLVALEMPKQVRRLVLLNATTRPAGSKLERFVDWAESFSPLGLPLRRQGNALDTRVFLHRIHCPVLLLVSADADDRLVAESNYLASKLPNSWMQRLEQDCWKDGVLEITEEIASLLSIFDRVPTKRPQKNRS